MSQYCGLNSDISPRQPLDVVGQGTGRVKARKCGLRQRQFNGQSKSHACKKRKMRNSFTTCDGQAGIQPFPGKLGSITWSGDLGRQTPSLCMFPHSFLFPQLYMADHGAKWYGKSIWSVEFSCSICVPSKILVHLKFL